MKATMTVRAQWPGCDVHEERVEVDMVENAAGRVVLKPLASGGEMVAIELVDLCGLEAKIRERTLVGTATADGAIMGDVTPKGKRSTTRGGLKVEGRPLHAELWANARAIDGRREEIREAYWARRRAEAEAAAAAMVPPGMVRLDFLRSEADGWVEIYSDPAGREIRSPKLAGSGGGRVAWMTPADHDEAAAAIEAADADRRADEAKAAAVRDDRDRKEAEAFATAAATGERVLIGRWTDECDGSADECDMDHVSRYALPDGSTKVVRVHTH